MSSDDTPGSAARPDTAGTARIRRRQIVWFAVGVGALAAVAVVLTNLAHDAPGAIEVLSDASPAWIALAACAEAACYVCLGLLLGGLLGRGLGVLLGTRVGLLIYGLGSLLPGSPAPGMAMAAVELRRRGLSATRLGLAMFWCTWFNVRAFLVLAAWTGAAAAVRGRVTGNAGLAVILAVCGIAISLTLASAAISSSAAAERLARLAGKLRWRGTGDAIRRITPDLHREAMAMVGGRRRQVFFGAVALGSWVGDAICLRLALISVDIHVSMGVVLIAYVATNIVSLVPFLPGGLGLVELTVAGVLSRYGVSVDRAVAGTLAWRAVSLFLPAIVGLLVYGSFRVPGVSASQPGPAGS